MVTCPCLQEKANDNRTSFFLVILQTVKHRNRKKTWIPSSISFFSLQTRSCVLHPSSEKEWDRHSPFTVLSLDTLHVTKQFQLKLHLLACFVAFDCITWSSSGGKAFYVVIELRSAFHHSLHFYDLLSMFDENLNLWNPSRCWKQQFRTLNKTVLNRVEILPSTLTNQKYKNNKLFLISFSVYLISTALLANLLLRFYSLAKFTNQQC